jgi:hypothetical protein
MSEAQYVRHISGQGDMWLIVGTYGPACDYWLGEGSAVLPKSEYRLCEPPGPKWEPIDAVYINVQVLDREGMPVFGQYRMMCSNVERKVTG